MSFSHSFLAKLTGVILLSCLAACTSGPFKINQSGKAANVIDLRENQSVVRANYQVLIIPSGAVDTHYISDKTSTLGGLIGTLVVGPVAGMIGGLAASTAGSAAASHAEESASKNLDSQDITQAIAPAALPTYLAQNLSEQLQRCGIASSVYPETLAPDTINWAEAHLSLPAGFNETLAPYRFFLQAGILSIHLRSSLTDDTLEGAAYVRVFESRQLKQMGRYSYRTGTMGSVTLSTHDKQSPQRATELAKAAQSVTQYLASGIAADICSTMKKF